MIEDTRFPVPLGEGVVTVAALREGQARQRAASRREAQARQRAASRREAQARQRAASRDERRQCSKLEIAGGHRPPLQLDFTPHFVDHVTLICY